MILRQIFGLALAALVVGGLAGCDRAADQVSTTANAPSPETATTDIPATDTPAADTVSDDNAMESVAKAKCELVSVGESGVEGQVEFSQQGEMVTVTGKVTGLSPGKHGFHVHEKGDLSDKETGKSTGGHYNPTDQPHGKMTDEKRHVGDLGNIEADADGVAMIDIKDSVISLTGDHSIIGRSIVIHADADQFTQPTGDAGARVAFGAIEKQ
ncbi:superoxide dismutase family protein [Stieleria varia]|uniref:Superoxide dismutase [Cu-Zn] n=1 Tax=Stieleria varia TaxID=2528005 RepID=A0A5C6B2Q6_9BACT|nr:superoxide dismutase family protein [Stieleria varia]TWU05821.1 Superoxide dismutase [Cu-Zn] precursor [Stieleria varia]